MKPTDRIGLPDLPICRDNPFAKGVSINQDMVMEEEMTRIERFARSCHEKVVDAAFDAVMSIAQSVDYAPNNPDPRNTELYANHPTLEEDLRKCFEEPENCCEVVEETIDAHYEATLGRFPFGCTFTPGDIRRWFDSYVNERQLLALGREEE